MVYFDTSYLVLLYLNDRGAESVGALARQQSIACSLHGRMECAGAFHRAYREGRLTQDLYLNLLDQFQCDDKDGAFSWLPVDESIVIKVEKAYRRASINLFLRSADALHLASASENGFREIYSNDLRMLAAAPLFKLTAKNVITPI